MNAPPSLSKTKDRFLKLKAVKFCILDNVLYLKYIGDILLKCLLKDDVDRVMHEFHGDDCGGHIYWKTTANKITRAGFYWPTFFPDVHKMVIACHKCQIFEGKKKLLPLPLKPISTEIPFQQWGLVFIREIPPHPLANISGF